MWSFYWLVYGQYTLGLPLFDRRAQWKAMIAGIPFDLGNHPIGWSASQTRLVIPHHAIQQFLHSLQNVINPI